MVQSDAGRHGGGVVDGSGDARAWWCMVVHDGNGNGNGGVHGSGVGDVFEEC